jgi:Tfp pilus assembly protein FimT
MIELVVVLATLGVFAVLGAPSFLSYYQAARLRVGAEELAAFINQGRHLAIRQNSTTCVHIGPAAVQYYVGGTVAGGVCACACTAWVGPGTDADGNVQTSGDIQLTTNTDFAFSYLGAATPGATITVAHNHTAQTLRVTVAPSGRVSVGP